MNLSKRDRKYVARDTTPEDVEVARSKGSYVFDSRGRKYVDFVSGWCVGNLGWGHKEIKAGIKRFRGPDYVNPGYLYKGWVELAELLARITPGKLQKSFRATGGTEAVEIALQAAMSCTKRHKFLSIEGSYHGDSIATISIGDSEFRERYRNLLPNCFKIDPPLDVDALDKVETRLKSRDIAAFIMEPIICNLAVTIPSGQFMLGVQQLCRKYGTLLIMDEVATGFGRTGKLFASEHFNLEPDILCLAKAITGGYGALGATVATERVAKSMEFELSYYSTFGWYPLSVEVAIANIQYILKHKTQLLKNVALISAIFKERLLRMNFKHTPQVRIKGLAIAIEFVHPGYAPRIVAQCKKYGLLLSESDDTSFTMFPALNISRTIAEEGLDILERCL